jgi:hypothetical protein
VTMISDFPALRQLTISKSISSHFGHDDAQVPRPADAKRAKKKKPASNTAEDQMAKAFGMLFFGLLGLGGLAVSGASSLSLWAFGPSDKATQVRKASNDIKTLAKFHQQSSNDPLRHKHFEFVLTELQRGMANQTQQADTRVLLAMMPELDEQDKGVIDRLLAEAGQATDPKALKPLFQEWLTVLKKHSKDPVQLEVVQQEANAYFDSASRYQNIQMVLWIAMFASLISLGVAVKQMK